MLAIEFKYYRINYRRLQEKYSDKFIVIKGKKVIGIYNSHLEAFCETIKHEELGTFLIQRILKRNRPRSTKRKRFSIFNIFGRYIHLL